jgi:hypothetical protein
MESAWFQRLKPKFDRPLSNPDFNCNLRRFHKAILVRTQALNARVDKVGRCSLTPY